MIHQKSIASLVKKKSHKNEMDFNIEDDIDNTISNQERQKLLIQQNLEIQLKKELE